MDRRTLVFFVSLVATLFLVNMFFVRQDEERRRVWNEQHKAKQAQFNRERAADISKRTKRPQELPLVDIYNEKHVLVANGTLAGDSVIVLAWTDNLPEMVSVRGHDSQEPLKSMRLARSAKEGFPVVYQSTTTPNLKKAKLPLQGTFEVQLVSSYKDVLSITLGEYRDGDLFIPAEDLTLTDDQKAVLLPQHNALVLYKTSEGYLPAGVYFAEQRSFAPLSHFSYLGNLQGIEDKKEEEVEISEAKYYVIETPYQQLVFSSVGGALVEINLPFPNDTNTRSIVLPTEIDRQMVEDQPQDAYFPAHAYSLHSETGKAPFPLMEKGQLGGYYPLLRRDLLMRKGEVRINPHYYAVNIVSEYPEVAERNYEVTYFDKHQIMFESTLGRRKIKRTYTVHPDVAPYTLELTIEVEGDARGLWLTSGIPEVEMISGSPAPAVKYRLTKTGKGEVFNIDPPKDTLTFSSINPDWLSNGNGFFGIILDPLTDIDPGFKVMKVSNKTVPSRLSLLDVDQDGVTEKDLPGYNMLLPLKSSGGSMKFRIYAGPYAKSSLEAVDNAFADPATGYNPDYVASMSFHGWFSFISEPFARLLFILMKGFHSLTGSWAISIILLTVVLRVMLYPLNAWSMRSMAKMQELGPEIHALNEKYKKDPKKLQLETMALYRERGVNPLSGCFPMLIQLPFLIAMFDLLRSTFELRGASFIPGWIDNLTSPDVLFSWTTPLPLIGNQFHLLPLILGAAMFMQQRLMSPAPKDPKDMTDQQRQARAMGTLMAPMFTILFYNFPSGLNIYWLSSTLLGMGQQWLMTRKKKKPVEVLPAAKPGKKGKK